jgi:hypothetical protein
MKEVAPIHPTAALIRSLPTLPKKRICELWKEHFGKPPGKIRLRLLLPVLAFRIQEKVYGGWTLEIKNRSGQISKSLATKKSHQTEANQRFKPGTRLVREWKGQIHEVILTADGYDYQGEKYKSLSPIACRITGTRWSGPAFFGTRKKELKA